MARQCTLTDVYMLPKNNRLLHENASHKRIYAQNQSKGLHCPTIVPNNSY